MPSITLKPKREKSLINRPPWVFSGAISRVDGQPRSGDTVDVVATDGRWLARGAYSPHSQIRVRAWSFDRSEAIDRPFFKGRLQQAVDLRRQVLADTDTNACRLVAGESDGLPGLIVDRYDRWVVCQFLSAGTERWKSIIVEHLDDLVPNRLGVYERSDVEVRTKEGLPLATGPLSGAEPPDHVEIRENGCRYRVDVKGDLMRASRGYKDINRLAVELLRPGGTLFTFSCSGLMGRDLFQKIVADAALDAGRHGLMLQWLNQPPDHPVAVNFPEGGYLKGLVCRMV